MEIIKISEKIFRISNVAEISHYMFVIRLKEKSAHGDQNHIFYTCMTDYCYNYSISILCILNIKK